MGRVTEIVGRGLAGFLTKPVRQSIQVATISQEKLSEYLQPGDVLLVEGRIEACITTLTGKPRRLPKNVLQTLAPFLAQDET